MSTKTRRELIDQILTNLGALPPGAVASAEDVALVDRIIDPTFERLSHEGIDYVPDPGTSVGIGGAIDAHKFLELAAICTDAAKCSWAQAGDASLYVLSQQAEDRLRRINRPEWTRKTLTTDPTLRLSIRTPVKVTPSTGW